MFHQLWNAFRVTLIFLSSFVYMHLATGHPLEQGNVTLHILQQCVPHITCEAGSFKWNISGQLRQVFYVKPLVALNRLCRFIKMPHCTFAYCLWSTYWMMISTFQTLTYQSNFTCCLYMYVFHNHLFFFSVATGSQTLFSRGYPITQCCLNNVVHLL